MDLAQNPFAPGAGTQPPELSGRDAVLASVRITLQRIKERRSDRSRLLIGLRGVGKTVLLNRIAEATKEWGYHSLMLEAPED
jgi:Cdc6-like AAA superfamily ATPase